MKILQRLQYIYSCMYWQHVKVYVYIFFAAQLPRHFVLIPNKSIYVLQGQSGEVTCEAEGPSVSTLKWEKEQDDKSYAAIPNSQVNVTKDTKYRRTPVTRTLKGNVRQFELAGNSSYRGKLQRNFDPRERKFSSS